MAIIGNIPNIFRQTHVSILKGPIKGLRRNDWPTEGKKWLAKRVIKPIKHLPLNNTIKLGAFHVPYRGNPISDKAKKNNCHKHDICMGIINPLVHNIRCNHLNTTWNKDVHGWVGRGARGTVVLSRLRSQFSASHVEEDACACEGQPFWSNSGQTVWYTWCSSCRYTIINILMKWWIHVNSDTATHWWICHFAVQSLEDFKSSSSKTHSLSVDHSKEHKQPGIGR